MSDRIPFPVDSVSMRIGSRVTLDALDLVLFNVSIVLSSGNTHISIPLSSLPAFGVSVKVGTKEGDILPSVEKSLSPCITRWVPDVI